MKKMKKLLAGFMAATMVMSMSVTAFAGTVTTTNTDADGKESNSLIQVEDEQVEKIQDMLDKSTKFTKEYVITNGTAPAETFDFAVEYVGYKNNEGESASAIAYPTVTLGDAVFSSDLSATDTADATVEITDYEEVALGVYTYKITEVTPTTKTAGTTYNEEPVYLVVTVLRDEASENHYVAAIHYETATGKKTSKIINSYDAGQLSVTKKIEGNMADMTKKFDFTVVFTPAEGTAFDTTVQIANDAAGTKREYNATTNADGAYTIEFELGDDETATFTNIPVGTTYTVSENEDGYTKAHTKEADGSITGGDTDEDEWTNTLTSEVDTGISLDNMPYIMVLALVALGLVGFVSKKRSMEF